MRNLTKRYRSALVIQIMLAQIQATYSIVFIHRNFLQQNGKDTNSYTYDDPRFRNLHYLPENTLITDSSPDLFLRKTRLANQPRMLGVDMSALRPDNDILGTSSRHKSPVNLVGIDISVLSRNPDPSLPVALPKHLINGKSIMGYDFDPKYDRLPVIRTKPVRTHPPMDRANNHQPSKPVSFMHLPLKVMTTYYSILTNKKQDVDFQLESRNDAERELKYTTNFILHLLYELSSNGRKGRYN